MPDLHKRALSALVFGVLVLGALWYGFTAIAFLFAALAAICKRELYLMCLTKKPHWPIRYYFIFVGTSPLLWFAIKGITSFSNAPPLLAEIAELDLVVLIALWAVAYFIGATWLLFNRWEQKITGITVLSFGIIYISLPFFLGLLYSWKLGDFATSFMFGLFLMIWTNDILAYFTGTLIGKTSFFPQHSPKKTWEGFIGGFIGTLVTGFLLSFWLTEVSMMEWFILAIMVSITGTVGDLFESSIKRQSKIKDSGNWMPGHGGLLDRMDGFIFIQPFVYAFLAIGGYL